MTQLTLVPANFPITSFSQLPSPSSLSRQVGQMAAQALPTSQSPQWFNVLWILSEAKTGWKM